MITPHRTYCVVQLEYPIQGVILQSILNIENQCTRKSGKALVMIRNKQNGQATFDTAAKVLYKQKEIQRDI